MGLRNENKNRVSPLWLSRRGVVGEVTGLVHESLEHGIRPTGSDAGEERSPLTQRGRQNSLDDVR